MSLAPVKMQPGGKQHFADNSYDVILSDLRMPGMTGEDLYRRIVNGRILRVASRRVRDRIEPIRCFFRPSMEVDLSPSSRSRTRMSGSYVWLKGSSLGIFSNSPAPPSQSRNRVQEVDRYRITAV